VSNIYLVRHGQAGTRDAYDSLSELGHRQCQLLGKWFASQGIKFAAAYSGEMSRQRQTAMAVRTDYGDGFPEIIVDPAWNEFDLDGMYRELAPALCAESPEFKRESEAMRRLLETGADALDAEVHRRWLPCDSALVEAWIRGRHPYAGESWIEFHNRITSFRPKLNSTNRRDNVAIFTSATPISIWAGLALDISDARVMKLAASLYNASFTVMKRRNDSLRLLSFNETPHLASPSMRTFR
jgi:broad specificity phosphatase PhoE